MIEPYVDKEVAWAVKTHQALRFFPDESVGYGYPDLYKELFGPDYQPEPYIVEEYKRARAHKWYMGEIFYLKELAEDCEQDGIYEFFFCGPPLIITGGTGSPINPQAIK